MPRHRHRSARQAGGAPSARWSQRGVTRMPARLSSGRQLSAALRAHSRFPNPGTGFGGRAVNGQAIGRANWSGSVVRGQMNYISARGNGFTRAALGPMFLMDRERNHYYWNHSGGFDYCFYRDPYGCDWFGWYIGPDFFWTQYYRGTWWIYDDMEGRWCYWSQGNWWWQDPEDPEMIYLYDNGDYIPQG
jgi:hypothetical protein